MRGWLEGVFLYITFLDESMVQRVLRVGDGEWTREPRDGGESVRKEELKMSKDMYRKRDTGV